MLSNEVCPTEQNTAPTPMFYFDKALLNIMYSLDSSNRDMFFMYVLIFAVIFPSTFFTIFQCCMDSCDLHPGGSCFKTSQISFSC